MTWIDHFLKSLEFWLVAWMNRRRHLSSLPSVPAPATPADDAIVIGVQRDLKAALAPFQSGDSAESMDGFTPSLVTLTSSDLSVHVAVWGGAGSGKSTFRDTLFHARLKPSRNHGQGEASIGFSQNRDELWQLLRVVTVERSVEQIEREGSLLVIDLEGEFVVPFNPLAGDNPEAQAMRSYTSVEKQSSSEFGPVTSRGLRAALLTAAKGGLTTAEIPLLFESEALRERLFPLLGEQEIRYWKDYGELKPAQAQNFAGPVTNKIDSWLSFSPIRRMLSCPEPLPWKKLFQDTPNLTAIINLGVNRFGSAGLTVGGLLLDSILTELMDPSRVHDPKATPVMLIIDEYQGLLTDGSVGSITHALCQSRKAKLSLLLLTQLMALVPSALRATIRANARTSQVFASGTDARDIVDDINFEGEAITREQARQLVAFQQVGQSVLTRRGQTSVLVQNTPPDPRYAQVTSSQLQAVYEAGCRTYGIPASEVDVLARVRRERLLSAPEEAQNGRYEVRRRTSPEEAV